MNPNKHRYCCHCLRGNVTNFVLYLTFAVVVVVVVRRLQHSQAPACLPACLSACHPGTIKQTTRRSKQKTQKPPPPGLTNEIESVGAVFGFADRERSGGARSPHETLATGSSSFVSWRGRERKLRETFQDVPQRLRSQEGRTIYEHQRQ